MSIARGDLAQTLHDLAEQGRHGDKADRLRLYTGQVTFGDADTVTVDFGDGQPVGGIPVFARPPVVGDLVQVLGLPGRFFCVGARGGLDLGPQTVTASLSVPAMVTDTQTLQVTMTGWAATPAVAVEWVWNVPPTYLWQSIRMVIVGYDGITFGLGLPGFDAAAAPVLCLLTVTGVWSDPTTPPTITAGGP